MKKYFLFTYFLFLFFCSAQSPKNYAELVIKKLTSADFSGRGYVDNGLKKAANEIAGQFEKTGLLKFGNSYFQEFTYPVNIIENSELKINGKDLKLGVDYLPGAGSPSLKGIFEPLAFNPQVLDSLVEWDNRLPFDRELERINNNSVYFPDFRFPENLTGLGGTANQIYKEIPQLITNETLQMSIPLIVELTPSKFIHTLSPIQTKTVDLFVSSKSVTEEIKTVDIDIKSHYDPAFQAQNVVGIIKGNRSDSLIVLTAHYDHLGKIGDVIFPGANDNASGVAFMLSMAKVYSKEQPKFDMVFIAFTGEEAGLKGSQYFVDHPLFDLKKIKFLINFDMVGTGEEGIQIVNGREFSKQYNKLEAINHNYNYLKQVKARSSSCNSDHCPFYQKGVPSFFIYTLGGKSGYHDIHDTEVSLFAFDKLVALITKFINVL